MVENLAFFLSNPLFEYIVGAFFIINSALELTTSDNTGDKSNANKINKFKSTTLILEAIIAVIIIYLKFKSLFGILLVVISLIAFIKNIAKVYTEKNCFSPNFIYNSVASIIIYLIFFSVTASEIYINGFQNFPHYFKEVLLLFYLTAKIILFSFITTTNIFALLMNIKKCIKIIFNKSIFETIKPKKNYDFIDYSFHFCDEEKNSIPDIYDIIIYILITPIIIILNIIGMIIHSTFEIGKRIINKITIIINNPNTFNNTIKKITNLSIALSLIIANILVILYDDYFTEYIKNIYSFISTVILLPIIYDMIKK